MVSSLNHIERYRSTVVSLLCCNIDVTMDIHSEVFGEVEKCRRCNSTIGYLILFLCLNLNCLSIRRLIIQLLACWDRVEDRTSKFTEMLKGVEGKPSCLYRLRSNLSRPLNSVSTERHVKWFTEVLVQWGCTTSELKPKSFQRSHQNLGEKWSGENLTLCAFLKERRRRRRRRRGNNSSRSYPSRKAFCSFDYFNRTRWDEKAQTFDLRAYYEFDICRLNVSHVLRWFALFSYLYV